MRLYFRVAWLLRAGSVLNNSIRRGFAHQNGALICLHLGLPCSRSCKALSIDCLVVAEIGFDRI